jgi:hypothetical protein
MREVYSVKIERPGMGDLDDLAHTDEAVVVAELVRVLLCCHDERIARVVVSISRIVIQEKAV